MRQVVTEHDAMIAVYDYLAEQLDDRLRYTYTDGTDIELIDTLVEALREPVNRCSVPCMKMQLANTVSEFAEGLTVCLVAGCEHDHGLEKEVISLVWNAHEKTADWLKRQGVIVGLSTN